MNYIETINNILKPKITEEPVVLDLFAGCGGLSLGFEAAGYKTIGYELLESASNTYSNNLFGKCHCNRLDIGFNYDETEKIDIVIGGPPCQPFSVHGKQMGMTDSRDGFPIFIDAIARLKPRVFLFENVRNLAFSHKWYLELIISELKKLNYLIDYKCINAVDYGVPQNRERLIVVGHKSTFEYPVHERIKTTVSQAIGDTMTQYYEDSKFLTPSQDKYISVYEEKSHCKRPRDLYPDQPARTITCRNLAGATSDMQRVRLPDGRRRRITEREAARLQSFPDWFEFCGNEIQRFNQIGNAVPPLLAYKIALQIKKTYDLPIKSQEEIQKINKSEMLFQL
ncbi:MAG: DNA cytosine methyltransferase [Victivallales bacterium]|nr:DNA cytosine methyltransferase [Victivallales bacterium]